MFPIPPSRGLYDAPFVMQIAPLFDNLLRRTPLGDTALRCLHYLLPRNRLGDAIFSYIKFLAKHRRLPHPSKPLTFNDHLLRLKVSGELYDPLRQLISDKILVKDYIHGILGPGFTPRTLAILSTSAEIAAFTPSCPCVIKSSHAGNRLMICKQASLLDLDKSTLTEYIKHDYYKTGRQANYRYLKKRLIVEELLCEDDGSLPHDFKFHCFYGEPQMIEVHSDRVGNHTQNFYSIDWQTIPVYKQFPPGKVARRPTKLDEMIEVARRLSAPFSFIRVDMYLVGGGIYVGELTNVPGDASLPLYPRSFEFILAPLFMGVPMDQVARRWARPDVGQAIGVFGAEAVDTASPRMR
jgi:hypothetical protein